MGIHCHAAMKAKSALTPHSYEPAALGPWDMRVAITHCGICHSDIHLIDDDWGMSVYPLVPGHEIVGTVTARGHEVPDSLEGKRVGIGWQRSACLRCPSCLEGDEPSCPGQQPTCVGHPGGFAREIVADSRFAFEIPEGLPSEGAAPLLCGGATVYTPLRRYGVAPPDRVGVIGIGGLGHLALQFASAFGCEVTAFSSSADKEAEARSLGAHHFVPSGNADRMKGLAGSFDFIINTVFADLDWALYVSLLKPGGRLCFVGAPPGPVSIHAFPLIVGRKSICGSVIGSRHLIREMLEFAARHGITARTEALPLDAANEAIAKVRANRARYRMVLVNPRG